MPVSTGPTNENFDLLLSTQPSKAYLCGRIARARSRIELRIRSSSPHNHIFIVLLLCSRGPYCVYRNLTRTFNAHSQHTHTHGLKRLHTHIEFRFNFVLLYRVLILNTYLFMFKSMGEEWVCRPVAVPPIAHCMTPIDTSVIVRFVRWLLNNVVQNDRIRRTYHWLLPIAHRKTLRRIWGYSNDRRTD